MCRGFSLLMQATLPLFSGSHRNLNPLHYQCQGFTSQHTSHQRQRKAQGNNSKIVFQRNTKRVYRSSFCTTIRSKVTCLQPTKFTFSRLDVSGVQIQNGKARTFVASLSQLQIRKINIEARRQHSGRAHRLERASE
jgi:hypothetical protein